MITFSEPTEWRNSSVLKVTGVTVRPGTYRSREGIETPFTRDLCKTIFSNFSSSVPNFLTHDDRESCGYMYKLGYDAETDEILYEGFIFDKDKATRIKEEEFNSVSPELDLDVDSSGNIVNAKITGVAFVRKPAISGTTVTKQMVAFSTPSHVWDYGKSDKAWSKPSLGEFTDKSWTDLTSKEKRDIAGHYAYSANMPPESFGDLKFPHHEPKSHNVNWSAVSNAMARLNQSDISTTDKKAVYKHLVSHYEEFKKEPPRMFDNGSVENMENTNYTMTSTNGTYMFAPTTSTITGTSYSVPEDVKDKEIAELKHKLAKFEGAVAAPSAPIAAPVIPAVAPLPPVINVAPVAPEAPKPDIYKEKYEGMLKAQLDTVSGELKNLGAKDVDTIGAGLDSEARFAMLRALKETMIKNTPTTTPPETIVTKPVTEGSKEDQIAKLLKDSKIDSDYIKYLKNL